LYDIKQNKVPYISRQELECAVGVYSDLPFRCAHVDRLLVDLLVALEIYQYDNEIYNQIYIKGLNEKTIVQVGHPIKNYLRGILEYGGISAAGVAVASTLDYVHMIPGEWNRGVEIIACIYFFSSLTIATLAMFYVVPRHNKRYKEATDLMGSMIRVY
jgi:hypothetical protein